MLDWIGAKCRVDRTRIYGVGFSMGGGSVTSYAARHLDPARAMFAAVVDHTGGVALRNTYASEPDDADSDDNTPQVGDNLEVPDILDGWYGAPATHLFGYQRCSTIDMDPLNGQIGSGTSLPSFCVTNSPRKNGTPPSHGTVR